MDEKRVRELGREARRAGLGTVAGGVGAGAILGLMMLLPPRPAPAADTLPSVSAALTEIGLSGDDKQKVLGGEIVGFTRPESSDRELVAGMVFVVKAKPARLIAEFEGEPQLNPDVTKAGAITGAGTLAELAELSLTPNGDDEAARYLAATPGEDLNLSAAEIAALHALARAGKTSKADVEAQLRQNLLGRYQAYRAKGVVGTAAYARSGGAALEPGEQLRRATEHSPVLKKYAPSFYAALLDYPAATPPGWKERFLWINLELDDRPTLVLAHRAELPVGEGYVLAQRHFYVSRSYNVEQEMAALLPVAEGTMVFYLNRTSTDQVAGFGSSAKRRIGRSVMAGQITRMWEKLQAETN